MSLIVTCITLSLVLFNAQASRGDDSVCATKCASSGACSRHGGVDCLAGADGDGSVICKDGNRDSSVAYSCGADKGSAVKTEKPKPAVSIKVKYYVNADPKSGENHEVHRADCSNIDLTRKHVYVELGKYDNCGGAVRAAHVAGYADADGCYICSRACHDE